jgi:hypothetical protein
MADSFSVAMCTYNGARFVGEQLASVAAQTREPDELVVCDDRSTDATTDIVKAFAASAPFPVRLHVNERNLGSTKNFERAIGLCGGDLIALADQDDVWLPGKLARMEEAFSRSPAVGLVFCDAEVVDEELRPMGYTVWESLWFDAGRQRALRRGPAFRPLLRQNVVTGAAAAFRSRYRGLVLPLRSLTFRPLGMPVINLIHDGWIALMISAVAELEPVAEPLVKYRQHSGQQLGMESPKPLTPEPEPPDLRTRAAAKYKELFLDEINFLAPMYERLASKRHEFDCEVVLEYLGARLAHLRARAGLPGSKLRRVPVVLREALTLRYSRYSNGVMSAAKDLLF